MLKALKEGWPINSGYYSDINSKVAVVVERIKEKQTVFSLPLE